MEFTDPTSSRYWRHRPIEFVVASVLAVATMTVLGGGWYTVLSRGAFQVDVRAALVRDYGVDPVMVDAHALPSAPHFETTLVLDLPSGRQSCAVRTGDRASDLTLFCTPVPGAIIPPRS